MVCFRLSHKKYNCVEYEPGEHVNVKKPVTFSLWISENYKNNLKMVYESMIRRGHYVFKINFNFCRSSDNNNII